MKVAYLSMWSNWIDLARQVQAFINDSHLVVIKGIQLDRDQFTKFMELFGTPSTKQAGDGTAVLEMGKNAFEVTDNWYDRKDEFILHYDGICSIPEQRYMPLTFLYGAEISALEGGMTRFYDHDDLYRSAKRDSILKRVVWANIEGDYIHKPELKPVRIHTLRHSPYSGYPYLLIDEWFTRRLYAIQGELPYPADAILQHYRNGFVEVYQHAHEWEPNDLLVWSNESFVHGRTDVISGTRVMWRGIVWNNVRHRVTLRNLETNVFS